MAVPTMLFTPKHSLSATSCAPSLRNAALHPCSDALERFSGSAAEPHGKTAHKSSTQGADLRGWCYLA